MEAYLTSEMIKAIAEGNLFRGIGFAVVFFFIWLEVKGVRKEIKTLNKTLGDSLSDGEKRFDKIEVSIREFYFPERYQHQHTNKVTLRTAPEGGSYNVLIFMVN